MALWLERPSLLFYRSISPANVFYLSADFAKKSYVSAIIKCAATEGLKELIMSVMGDGKTVTDKLYVYNMNNRSTREFKKWKNYDDNENCVLERNYIFE